MGNAVSGEWLQVAVPSIVSEFINRGLFGKMWAAVTSSEHCGNPEDNNRYETKEYLRCQMLRSQHEPWTLIFWLVAVMIFIISCHLYRIYRSSKKTIGFLRTMRVSSNNQRLRLTNINNIEQRPQLSSDTMIPITELMERPLRPQETMRLSQPQRSYQLPPASREAPRDLERTWDRPFDA